MAGRQLLTRNSLQLGRHSKLLQWVTCICCQVDCLPLAHTLLKRRQVLLHLLAQLAAAAATVSCIW